VSRIGTGRLPASILPALLCILVLATAAHADCAWILWDMWKSGAKSPLGSFETQVQCEDAAGRYEARALRDGKDKDVQYVCFPDTVDPRAPKPKP
jgi:hypothetical protein